jgi:type VI secretion system lysozyme-like protein
MANERTLFERILEPDVLAPRSARERKAMMSESVLSHLNRLLNSRAGCCQTLPDYGMPEIESWSGTSSELSRQMESALQATISAYEPRLRKVRVQLVETEEVRLTPKFHVSAELDARDDFIKDVSFTTFIDPTGKIEIG